MIYEVSMLLRKVTAAEDLVRRAERYFEERSHDWPDGIAAYFMDLLERKRDLIDYEWYLIGKLGDAIASGRSEQIIDSYAGRNRQNLDI